MTARKQLAQRKSKSTRLYRGYGLIEHLINMIRLSLLIPEQFWRLLQRRDSLPKVLRVPIAEQNTRGLRCQIFFTQPFSMDPETSISLGGTEQLRWTNWDSQSRFQWSRDFNAQSSQRSSQSILTNLALHRTASSNSEDFLKTRRHTLLLHISLRVKPKALGCGIDSSNKSFPLLSFYLLAIGMFYR